jgi:predicted double-glycine peptidase
VADFSCGSAALATLLTYHYERPIAERTILHDMIEHGDPKRIEAKGFSMLDMKDYLTRQGLQSGGFRLPLEKIAEVRVPGIVLINHNGYNHFAVLEGLSDGRVLLADPSLGTRATDIATFEKEWNGILFLVISNADRAQRSFNMAEDWATQPHASWDQIRNMFGVTQLGWRNAQVF